jgi:translation initiation factor IF-2
MLLLGGTQQDDDFLGGLGLSKKEKKNTNISSANERDETAIGKKIEEVPEKETEKQREEIKEEEISGSVDATIIKRAETKSKSSTSRNNFQAGPKSGEFMQREKYSPSSANKISFEQGKISKKRTEQDTSTVNNSRFAQANPPKATASGSREDRRRNATGQAVIFNRAWGGGQKIQIGGSSRQGPKKGSTSSTDYKVSQTISKKEEIIVGDSITVKEFAEKMGVPIAEVIKKFIANKMLLSLNSSIDFETATLIAMEFEIKVIKEAASAGMTDILEGNLQSILELDKSSETKEERPPIVTIMGHVDHGKTTLLDYLRKTVVADKEHGGITQSIGGSQIVHNGKKVTFIDTPGHALFTSLRARGSKITDIVIIVVAADDGIMKQTVEAINHAKAANVPIIVAVTKIDKGIDNTETIKTQLSEHGLITEDRGGDVPLVKVSGVTGQGIDDLMDQILLHAEVSELVCDPERNGIGVVLEAHKDIQKGVMTTMIVMTGTIKVGDILRVYNTFGKIKKIYNRKGQEIKTATGGDPVMILGINDVPEAGKLAEAVKDEKTAKSRIAAAEVPHETIVNSIVNKIIEGEMTQINLLIKADSRGSLEALKAAIGEIELPDNISFKIVHSDIGNFFDSDLDLAKASNGLLIGFGTTVSNSIKAKIDQMGVTLKTFNIIYEIADYLDALVKGSIKHDPVEVQIGKLTVLGVFYRKGNDTIFGGKIFEGEARNGSYFRILRGPENEVIDAGKITSLQKGQENVDKIGTGHECGMKARVSKKIELNDTIEFYVME